MKQLLNTLYVTTPDAYLALDGENIVIRVGGEETKRIPLHNLENIVTFGWQGASPALMHHAGELGIGLTFLSKSGRFLCRVEGEKRGNVLLRRAQYRIADGTDTPAGSDADMALGRDVTDCTEHVTNSTDTQTHASVPDDRQRALRIAINMIGAKTANARAVLTRALRDHPLMPGAEQVREAADGLCASLPAIRQAVSMEQLRGLEGVNASCYFGVLDHLILQNREDFRFRTRERRPPTDPVNALLSFCYTLLANECASALESVGLDPYVGFMHTDRPGRRSLALDLMEELRCPFCDRFVLSLINLRQVTGDHFAYKENGAVLMDEDTRRIILTAWQKKKQETVKHPFLGESCAWGVLPYVQAQLLARYIRGDLDDYPPYLWR